MGAVEFDHGLVDGHLVLGVHAGQGLVNRRVDALYGLEHALAAVAGLVAVAQFDRFVGAGGGARGHGGAAERAVLQHDFDLDRGIAPAVEDFAGADVENGGHGSSSGRKIECEPV